MHTYWMCTFQSRLLVYLTHDPAGTSTMNMFHWIQMVNSNKMQAYDYGSPEKNIEHYGTVILTVSFFRRPYYLVTSFSKGTAVMHSNSKFLPVILTYKLNMVLRVQKRVSLLNYLH